MLPEAYVNTILVVIVFVFLLQGQKGMCGGPDKRMDGLRLGPGFGCCCLPYLLDTNFCTFCCIFVSLACGRQQCEKNSKGACFTTLSASTTTSTFSPPSCAFSISDAACMCIYISEGFHAHGWRFRVSSTAAKTETCHLRLGSTCVGGLDDTVALRIIFAPPRKYGVVSSGSTMPHTIFGA